MENTKLADFMLGIGQETREKKGAKERTALESGLDDTLFSEVTSAIQDSIETASKTLNDVATVSGDVIGSMIDFGDDTKSATYFASRLNQSPLFAGLKFSVLDAESGKSYAISDLKFKVTESGIREKLQRLIDRNVTGEIVEAYKADDTDTALASILSRTVDTQLGIMQNRAVEAGNAVAYEKDVDGETVEMIKISDNAYRGYNLPTIKTAKVELRNTQNTVKKLQAVSA